MEKYIENLNWRYATKIFDPNKKVSNEDLNQILEVFRLSASSYGLQPWKIYIVENQEKKNLIQANARNQSQITQNSHLLVLAKPSKIDEHRVAKNLESLQQNTGLNKEKLAGLQSMLLNFVNNTSNEELSIWAREQVHLALGNLLSYLAEKRIDSCPIGGFNKKKIDEILDLSTKGYESLILLPLGYRDENDKYATQAKSRLDKASIVEIIN